MKQREFRQQRKAFQSQMGKAAHNGVVNAKFAPPAQLRKTFSEILKEREEKARQRRDT